MTAPFAFAVAVDQPTEDYAGYYDAEKQEFVWEGGADATLGSPVCSATHLNDPQHYVHCKVEGMTYCSLDTPCDMFWACYGYQCDYG